MPRKKNENILGISSGGPGGVALFQNKKLILAVNEERMTGIKLDRSFPKKSLDWCLNEAGLSFGDVDTICYGFSNGIEQGNFMSSMIRRIQDYSGNQKALKTIFERLSVEADVDTQKRNEFYKEASKLFPGAPIHSCPHHQAHQACAFVASPFKSALVVTSDGRGDFESFTVSAASPKGVKKIYSAFSWESLGYFYGRITHLCGFKPERHEGKILGLAACGDPRHAKKLVDKMIRVKDGKIQTSPGDFYKPFFTNYPEQLTREASEFSREDLAAAAQLKLEEVTLAVVSDHIKSTGLTNVCLAGGVFTNVRLNQKIRDLPDVKDIFVYPNMGDDGLCTGAVYHKFLSENPAYKDTVGTLYLGPNISSSSMLAKLLEKGFQVDKPEKIYDALVELLKRKSVVALVQGRAEFGPRALCNRSLLLTPDSRELSASLNERLNRNDFMPFAPVIASNLAGRCLRGYNSSQLSARHMVTTYNVTPEFKENSPAVVHVDGSVRPQVLFEKENPFMFKLLNKWHQKTGKLCLINTSYNLHESPIASTEDDVIHTFESDAADYLLFPPYIAHQKGGKCTLV